jgi:2-keto-3-deoxy-L-rhamnonate aldolase RhmA
VRTIARAGFDWIWLDNEHAYHSTDKLYNAIRTAEDLGVIALLRVRQGDYPFIAHALDMAPSGVIIPRVETPEQMRAVVDAAKYPPVGKRGFGMRPSLFGKHRISMRDRMKDQNEDRVLVVQLETPEAIGNIESIYDAADGQVNAFFFGPSDYQLAIGKLDEPFCDEVVEAARRLVAFSEKHHLSNGLPAVSVEAAQRWRDIGFNLIAYKSDDQFLFDAMVEGREAVKDIK